MHKKHEPILSFSALAITHTPKKRTVRWESVFFVQNGTWNFRCHRKLVFSIERYAVAIKHFSLFYKSIPLPDNGKCQKYNLMRNAVLIQAKKNYVYKNTSSYLELCGWRRIDRLESSVGVHHRFCLELLRANLTEFAFFLLLRALDAIAIRAQNVDKISTSKTEHRTRRSLRQLLRQQIHCF